MKKILLLILLTLISCSKEMPKNQNRSSSIDTINSVMDVIALQSKDSSNFTLSNSNVIAWSDINLNGFCQSNSIKQPLLNNGVSFDGINDDLVLNSEIVLKDYSFYAVIQYTGNNIGNANNKALISALSTRDWIGFGSGYNFTINTNSSTKRTVFAGYKGNRPIILGIRKSGDTFKFTINDRVCKQMGTLSVINTFFSRIGSIYGLSGFNPAMNLKALCVTTKVLSDADSQFVVDALYKQYDLELYTQADNVCGFGDSNTVGTGATSYLVGLSSRMNLAYLNAGISGSFFTNVTNQVGNGFDRYQSQITTKPYTDYIVIQYGTNDIANPNITPEMFEGQLNIMVADLIQQGYDPNRICLCSNPYQKNNANELRLNQFRDKIYSVAINNGTAYFDLLKATRDGGGNALLSDNVHLNSLGMQIWEDGVFDAFNP